MRSGPGEARTILLLHIISVRPSKQPLMVRTFLKVYMELGSYFLFLQEQIKDIIIRYGLGGVFLLFILGPNLGGERPERGLRGGRRRGSYFLISLVLGPLNSLLWYVPS